MACIASLFCSVRSIGYILEPYRWQNKDVISYHIVAASIKVLVLIIKLRIGGKANQTWMFPLVPAPKFLSESGEEVQLCKIV